MLNLPPSILLLSFFLSMVLPPATKAVQPACSSGLSLDGVDLTLCAPFLSEPRFSIPDPTNAIQLEYAIDRDDPNREFSITAIPFGMAGGSEIFLAKYVSTDAGPAREQLRAFRQSQGGNPWPGPIATLFGQNVESIVSRVNLPGVTSDQPALLTEWVATAGDRLWLVRLTTRLNRDQQGDIASSLTNLRLNSPDLNRPSTSLAGSRLAPDPTTAPRLLSSPSAEADLATLPTPSWWNGPCDTFNYYARTGKKYYAYPLGTSYRGMEACGPRPAFEGVPDVGVYFFPGAWGALEWECVELSLRFLYLAYGIKPYPGNGNQIVQNYPGTLLKKIANGTIGLVPVPGDVLSYCSSCSVGHTSVVTASSVDSSGNGSVSVIEENNSAKGQSILKIVAWKVSGNVGPIIGWLHPADASSSPQGYNLYIPLVTQ